MTPQIPWLRVFVEGVVIVGSILLAFGIQAWWEERQEAELERQVLTTLVDELQVVETGLDRLEQGWYPAVGEATQYLLAAIADPEGRPADSVATAVHTVDGTSVVSLELASYELLVSSGTLDILSDPALAQSLWRLDNALGALSRAEASETAFLEQSMYPYYDSHVDRGQEVYLGQESVITRGRVRRRLQWYQDRGIEGVEFREFPIDYTDLLDDPQFSNLIHRRLDLMISVGSAHRALREVVNEVRQGAVATLER